MRIGRSTFYDTPDAGARDLTIIAEITALSDLPQSREEHEIGWSEPAVGSRHHLVTIATGFVYLAAILDAWSRRVVGYAISRSIDARLAVAALKAAISARNPPRGCVHHSDRGSQYASEDYRAVLQNMVSPAPWAGAAIPTTTPRPRAS